MWIITVRPSGHTICCISREIWVKNVHLAICKAVSYWSFAVLFGFSTGKVHMGFVVGEVALDKAFSEYSGLLLSVLFLQNSFLI
jgi:hypothetical protein